MIYDDQTSSAMNYYEELGVGLEATEQEIRKAHRRLVKLMHPDAQPDQNLKMLAETQMRRLNSIVATLLDPAQRRSYDEQLHAVHAAYRPAMSTGRLSWRGIPWWLASSVGAIVLTLVAVWLWADHLGSSFGNRSNRTTYIPPAENAPVAALPPAPSYDPDRTKPLGASYTSPLPALPPASVSDQPKLPSNPVVTAPVTAPPVAPPTVPVAAPKPAPVLPAKTDTPLPKPEKKPEPATVASAPKPQAPPPPPPVVKPVAKPTVVAAVPEVKKEQPKVKEQAPKVVASVPARKPVEEPKKVAKTIVARDVPPAKPTPPVAAPIETPHKKTFLLPAGSLVASVRPVGTPGVSQLPAPPRVSSPAHDDATPALPGATLPTAVPPKPSVVTTAAAPAISAPVASGPRDPLEGEWVYAPKEPERQRAGFYPPEFIDLKLFSSSDPGTLKGQYNARYVVSDRPVSPEVHFDLASASKGSRRFLWQSSSGAKGTLSIDSIDDQTIRIDWHTTSAVRGPTLTSGTATLVRRQ